MRSLLDSKKIDSQRAEDSGVEKDPQPEIRGHSMTDSRPWERRHRQAFQQSTKLFLRFERPSRMTSLGAGRSRTANRRRRTLDLASGAGKHVSFVEMSARAGATPF